MKISNFVSAILVATISINSYSEDADLGRLVLIDDLTTNTQVVEKVTRSIVDQHHHDVAITNVQINSGEIISGIVINTTNLVSIVPVISTTAVVQITAPYSQGYYNPGMYSAIEIGDLYQALFSQRLQVGTAAYFPSPSRIRFTDGLTTNQYDTCKSLQDYLDAANPDAVGELLHGYVPCVGDSAINGSLRVSGTLASEGTIQITNANIIAKKFSVVDGNLTAIGLTLTNGFCRLQAAEIEKGASSPRWHLIGNSVDPLGCTLTNFTFGGTWKTPTSNLKAYIDASIRSKGDAIKYEIQSDIPDMISGVVGESIDRVSGSGRVWNARNNRTAILDNDTFPNGGSFYFPHYVHSAEVALNNPLHFKVVLNYSGNVPSIDFGVYAPGGEEDGWRVIGYTPDDYTFSPSTLYMLEYMQISTNTLIVTRRTFLTDLSPSGEGNDL